MSVLWRQANPFEPGSPNTVGNRSLAGGTVGVVSRGRTYRFEHRARTPIRVYPQMTSTSFRKRPQIQRWVWLELCSAVPTHTSDGGRYAPPLAVENDHVLCRARMTENRLPSRRCTESPGAGRGAAQVWMCVRRESRLQRERRGHSRQARYAVGVEGTVDGRSGFNVSGPDGYSG